MVAGALAVHDVTVEVAGKGAGIVLEVQPPVDLAAEVVERDGVGLGGGRRGGLGAGAEACGEEGGSEDEAHGGSFGYGMECGLGDCTKGIVDWFPAGGDFLLRMR